MAAPARKYRPGAMTAHDLERYRHQRKHGRIVRVRNVICYDCARAALMRIPENKHSAYDHRHLVCMGENARTSALAASARRQVITTAKALADLITPAGRDKD